MLQILLGVAALISSIMVFLVLGYQFIILFLAEGRSLEQKNFEVLPEITVIVPTYNEESCIRDKLENLFELDYPVEKIDVMVVDGGSDDSTEEIVADFDVRFIDIGHRGKIKAMNRGMEEAKTDLVLFTDADVILNKNALKNSLKYMNEDVAAVGGISDIKTDLMIGDGKVEYHSDDWKLRCKESRLINTCSLDGKFILVDKNSLGRIDEDAFVDDQEITNILWKKGFRSVVVPDVKVSETSSDSMLDDLNNMRRRCRLSIMNAFQNLDVLKDFNNYSYLVFPFRRFFNYMIPFYFFFIGLYLSIYAPVYLLILLTINIVLSLLKPKIMYYNLLVIALCFSWIDILFGNIRKGCRWDY